MAENNSEQLSLPTTPAAPAVAEPAPVVAPAAIPAPEQSPALPAASTPVETTIEPTVLGVEPAVEPVKPEPAKVDPSKPVVSPDTKVDAKPDADVKPEDAKVEPAKVEVPDALPVYEALTLPEGVTLPAERISEIDSMFGNFEKASKADHAEVVRFRQAAVDYQLAIAKDMQASLQKAYQDHWESQTAKWRKDFEADPEIGGNRKDTVVAAANQFIRTHGGSADQQKSFRKLLQDTGLGNHPDMIRVLANAGMSRTNNEGVPLPAQAPAPAKMGKIARMYGKRGGNK